VAKATVFLATNDARWATGTLLTVDGGYTAP
jgi:NAD(P)-dependent dehydrogenase (short-subunit alcohol dehydrogenase family)